MNERERSIRRLLVVSDESDGGVCNEHDGVMCSTLASNIGTADSGDAIRLGPATFKIDSHVVEVWHHPSDSDGARFNFDACPFCGARIVWGFTLSRDVAGRLLSEAYEKASEAHGRLVATGSITETTAAHQAMAALVEAMRLVGNPIMEDSEQ